MITRRRMMLLFLAALVLAGAYGAMRNLPVMNGCNFYADCPQSRSDLASP